jgi:phosphoribosylformylglycinamidine synthase I
LGVCNGFQILCESGLLPGALLQNENQQFICKNVYIKTPSSKALAIPIAHGEGRYFADKDTLDHLEKNNQVIFRYCDQDGHVGGTANPNGSTNDIAGICNDKRNVFGMMPHPERATSSALNNIDGKEVFKILGLSKA